MAYPAFVIAAAATLASGAAMPALAQPPAPETAMTAPGPEGPLSGTFVPPAAGGPVVLIIPGSGPTDRDGNNPMGVRAGSYRLLAEALAQRGIGSLRADKRGMFASAPALSDPSQSRIAGYVEDIAAWRDVVRRETGRDCIWLLGHSEGGLVALAAAQELDHLCGLVLVATPGRTIAAILREQLAANPANAPVLPQAMAAIATLEAGGTVDPATLHPALLPLFGPQVQDFMRDLMAHDSAQMAASLSLPVLVVQGGKDIQVTMADADALVAARSTAELATFPAMNHVLKDVASDDRAANLATYGDPALPLAEGLADRIAAFVGGKEPVR